jgi:beta-lactamase regulating signal transducer with metallopeptidase domain/predicted  nucleic acid-binding Zn-ribbon protein
MIQSLIEAALRALIMALAVWAGLRVFRVSNVLAQKAAWGLVLLCAVVVPLVMHWRVLPESMAIKVPAIPRRQEFKTPPVQDATLSPAEALPAPLQTALESPRATKPRAAVRKSSSAFAGHQANGPDLARPLQSRSVMARPAVEQSAAPASINASSASSPAIQLQPAAESFSSRMQGWVALGLQIAGRLAVVLYLVVCVALLIRMAHGVNLAMTLWQKAEVFVPYPQDDPGYGLRMRFSRAVSSPVTIGSGVLLPYECLEWDAQKLRIVLAHERAHIRQGDFYLQLLAGLYSAVFWFSPLGWWLKRKLSDLGEVISDRAGLDEASSCASYAQILLEFAAMPRPTQIDMTRIGVAMARSRNLSQRIERLLDESSFRNAFANSRWRVLVAVLLVPVALIGATSLIRVEAAGPAQEVVPPSPAPGPAAAPNPATAPSPASAPDSAPAPAAQPAPPQQSADQAPPLPAPQAPSDELPSAAMAPTAPAMPPMPTPDAIPATRIVLDMPPMPPSYYGEIHDSADDAARALAYARAASKYAQDAAAVSAYKSRAYGSYDGRGYSYSYSSRNGDTLAIVTGDGNVSGSGEFGKHFSEVRKQVHGDFLYYEHQGHAYVIDDPALVAKAKALYAPIDELGRQQEALGKKQEELGRQQEELGKKQEQASVPTPDISKEMAELNEAVAKLDAKKGSTVSQDELADIEGKLGDIQGRLGELQGKMGEQMGRLGEMQGKLGEEQGKLGEEQGRLGEQQGKLAEEADRKLKLMFEEGIHSGKARPVE